MAEGHRQRLIEKVLQHGVDVLLEHEFLELCLFSVYKRCDTNKIAHALLDKFGNIENLCNAPIEEIVKVPGVAQSAARYIKLIPHISKGYALYTSKARKEVFDSHDKIEKRCIALLNGFKDEAVFLLCFDKTMHLIKEVKIAEGLPGFVNVELRKITDAVAATSTSYAVLCHNHPSGVLEASQNDIDTTRNVAKLLNSINIELLSHYIVAENNGIKCVLL